MDKNLAVGITYEDLYGILENPPGGNFLEPGVVEVTPMEFCGDEWGMVRIDVHMEKLNDLLVPGSEMSVLLGTDVILYDTSKPLYVMGWKGENIEELSTYTAFTADPEAFTPLEGQLSEPWAAYELNIKREGVEGLGDGEELRSVGFPDGVAYIFQNANAGRAVTLNDVFASLVITRTVASQMLLVDPQDPEADAVTVRYGEVVSQMNRAATRRKRPRSVTLKNRKGETVVKLTGLEEGLALGPSSRKTFSLLNREATRMSISGEYRHDGETVCRTVLSVKGTADLYGITEASARKRLRKDFKAIANEGLTMERAKGKGWIDVPVAGGAFGIRGDNAIFTFSPDIMQLVLNPTAPRVDFPPALFSTDDTNYPAAFQIGAKLYAHDSQNSGKANQDRMRLDTLLNAAKELPSIEELKKGRRSPTERIMGPFEAAMEHLVDRGVLTAWDYCHEKGEPLTAEEYQAIQTEHDLGKPTPWDLAKNLLITWELGRRYPMHEAARLESREKRRTAALEAKAKKEKEAKAKEKRIRGKMESMEAKKRYEESLQEEKQGRV